MKELDINVETVMTSKQAFNDIKLDVFTKKDLTEINQQNIFNAVIVDVFHNQTKDIKKIQNKFKQSRKILITIEQRVLYQKLQFFVYIIYSYNISIFIVNNTKEIQQQGSLAFASKVTSFSDQFTTKFSVMQKKYMFKAETKAKVFDQDF